MCTSSHVAHANQPPKRTCFRSHTAACRTTELARGVEPAKSAADDDDAVARTVAHFSSTP